MSQIESEIGFQLSLHVKHHWNNKFWFETRQSFNKTQQQTICFFKLLVRKSCTPLEFVELFRLWKYGKNVISLSVFSHTVSCSFWESTRTSKHQVDYSVVVLCDRGITEITNKILWKTACPLFNTPYSILVVCEFRFQADKKVEIKQSRGYIL